MTPSRPSLKQLAVLVLIVAVILGTLPGLVLAQSQSGVGGTVVVADGETVSELSGVAGTVIVQEGGTVTGDVSGLAGNVYIHGTVEGDVTAAAGNVEITGTVDGNVATGSGNLLVAEGATIRGTLEAGAGNIRIDGTIDGDVAVGAETITLGEAAAIGGDLRYDGDLQGNTAAVAGEITRDSTLGFDLAPTIQPIASWLFAVYALALNLLLGAALLALFPDFSRGVADRVASDPARTGLVGLGVLVGVPILLIAAAITIVGIPFTIAGAFVFALVSWIAVVYGRFAVAAWLLSKAGEDNRWLALVVGLVGGALLAQVPFVGGLANLLLFLLGLGALSVGLYAHARRHRGRESPSGVPERGSGPGTETGAATGTDADAGTGSRSSSGTDDRASN
ncbi:polymer-forming cytoskeletal protein [Halobacteria archaeon AArc-m2/3/4]|uniref:Polymer-forming cytoskeletal protein n=1 Tax=Natronoglomus mannanivorans TaxID=2979990 RepID=A0ABT2QAL5_9EURY|nr:polymer-forming cytoskeletal protein [Halobacteria archaeon AArc-m2/3/4]